MKIFEFGKCFIFSFFNQSYEKKNGTSNIPIFNRHRVNFIAPYQYVSVFDSIGHIAYSYL